MDYLLSIDRLSDLKKELATLSPEELIRRYCVAEEAEVRACSDRRNLLWYLSYKLPDDGLYMPLSMRNMAQGASVWRC